MASGIWRGRLPGNGLGTVGGWITRTAWGVGGKDGFVICWGWWLLAWLGLGFVFLEVRI